jgi:hypothetical protein
MYKKSQTRLHKWQNNFNKISQIVKKTKIKFDIKFFSKRNYKKRGKILNIIKWPQKLILKKYKS